MLVDGLRLMVVGMAVVFCFLAVLVLAMQVSARFFTKFAKYFPEESPRKSALIRSGEDYADVAVALAAVQVYTNK